MTEARPGDLPKPGTRGRRRWLASRQTVGALAVLLLALPVAEAQSGPGAGPGPEIKPVTILATFGLAGKLQEVNGATAAAVAGTVQSLAARLRLEGRAVVCLDLGRTVGPYAESRLDGGRAILEVLRAAGCQAYAPDPMDLTVGDRQLTRLAGSVPFPFLAPYPAWPVAGQSGFQPRVTLQVADDLEFLFSGVMDPGFQGDLVAAGLDPQAIPDPGAVLPGPAGEGQVQFVVCRSRGHGTQLISRELTWRLLENPGGTAVLIDPDLGRDLVLRCEAPAGPVFLIGLRLRKEEGWPVAQIDLALRRSGPRWEVTSAALEVLPADPRAACDPALAADIQNSLDLFRARYRQPLPPGAPDDWSGLARFILESIREEAAAEVTVWNRGGIRPVAQARFEQRPLTREVVVRMLALDQRLVTGMLSGSDLEELVSESARRVRDDGTPRMDGLVFAGLTFELSRDDKGQVRAGRIRVNGRPLRPEDPYRIASSTYLLSGGDGYSILAGMTASQLPGGGPFSREVRDDVVIPRLEEAGRPFRDLEQSSLWRYGLDRCFVALDGVRADRPEDYSEVSDSRVQASDTASLVIDSIARLTEERLNRSWENYLRLRFGLLGIEDAAPQEIADQLRFDTSLVFLGRTWWGGHPYAGLVLETEFRRNRDSAGALLPRRLETSLGAGLDWNRPLWPRLRVGVVGRYASSSAHPSQFGLSSESIFLWKSEGRRPGAEARFLLESLWHGEGAYNRADLDLRLHFPLWGALAVSPAFNGYLFQDTQLGGVARYFRFSLGLSYTWQGKHQSR